MTNRIVSSGEAETAIRKCLNALRQFEPSQAQLSDLADAIDAFRAQTYGIAVALAGAALLPRRAEDRALRPAPMARTLREMEDDFAAVRKARQPSAQAASR